MAAADLPNAQIVRAAIAKLDSDFSQLEDQRKRKQAELESIMKQQDRIREERARQQVLLDDAERIGLDGPIEERKEAAGGSVWNMNSWHWEERNMKPWITERLTAEYKGLEIPIAGGTCTIGEVSKIDGDATINVRKGKKHVGFELKVELKHRTRIVDGEGTELVAGDGTFFFEEVSNDYEDDGEEYEVTAKLDGSSSGHDRARSELRSVVVPRLRVIMHKVVHELLEMGKVATA